MMPFKFRLERVLEWRELQMRAEEEKLAVAQQRLEAVEHRIRALASAELKSEWGLRKLPAVAGTDLHALSAFQDRARKLREGLELEKQQGEKQVAAQRTRLLRARKDFRVIERLRENRLSAWQYLSAREIESIAADAHNSKLIRSRDDESESSG
jgi:flagellar export protein FliJ